MKAVSVQSPAKAARPAEAAVQRIHPLRPMLELVSAVWAWIVDALTRLMVGVIRIGPIPCHVAFVMDGNRRYARRFGLDVSKGHAEGADTLEQTLDWCLKLGVKTVTVFAFSTENFSRNKEREVDPIMQLCTDKFKKFASHSELIEKHNIAVRVYGKLHLLPRSVQNAAALATKMTQNNANATLNVCMPYTSREEITDAIQRLVAAVEDGVLNEDDISEEVLEAVFWTGGVSGPLDILVRTSGEVRLSDFMMWQASKSCQIHFLKIMWPDFTFWHMLPALLQYQANFICLSKSRRQYENESDFLLSRETETLDTETIKRVDRVKAFLAVDTKHRLNQALNLVESCEQGKSGKVA
ncbi:hypothetical protein HDU80_008605 [Chytriomyces hyalinus]|nr:hypothetical protein HDU80_008605 [Chytriomyces hyalinus]